MNSTIVLNRLVAARNEGGVASAVTAAQALVGQYYPGRTFDVEATVRAVFAAGDRFDQAGAETAINEALATLAQPEPVVVADAEVAQDTSLEARVTALEALARSRGFGHHLATGTTLEQRVANLEAAAHDAGLL